MPGLESWDSFYIFLGSAAGALIGWQVVLRLIADRPAVGSSESAAAFGRPTIVHFCAALLLAAFMLAPWDAATLAPATMWGLLGIAGVVYAAVVTRRMNKQNHHRPEFENWLFRSALPIAAYTILAVSAVAAPFAKHVALFAVAASGILLLFIGIHNAWDEVTYHVYVSRNSQSAGIKSPAK